LSQTGRRRHSIRTGDYVCLVGVEIVHSDDSVFAKAKIFCKFWEREKTVKKNVVKNGEK